MVFVNASEQLLVKPTKKRWLVLCLAVILYMISVYTALCFGPVNNIIVSYFQVSYVTSDWITLSPYILSAACCALAAWFSFVNMLNLKFVLLLASVSMFFDAICILIAFSYPKLYFLMVIGQLISGIGKTAAGMLLFSVGAIWFPENEVALATGFILMGGSFGMALSEILPETVLKVPNYPNTSGKNTNSTGDWISADQHRVEIMYLIIVCVLVLNFVCTITFLTRQPEYPPSQSQAVKRSNSFNPSCSFRSFLKELKELHQDRMYLLLQLGSGFDIELYIMLTVIMQQVVDDILSQSNVNLNSSITSGLVLLCRSLGVSFSSPLGGKILDRYKQYRLQMITGIMLSFLSTVGIFLSWFYVNFVGLFLCMFLSGSFSGVYVSATFDALAQHTYPKNILFLSNCTYAIRFSIGIIMSEFARLIFYETDALGVMIFYMFLKFLSVVISFFIKPDLKRLRQERNIDNNIASERTPILSE